MKLWKRVASRWFESCPVRSTLVAAEERPGAPGLSWWWFAVAPVQAVFVIRFWGPGVTGAWAPRYAARASTSKFGA